MWPVRWTAPSKYLLPIAASVTVSILLILYVRQAASLTEQRLQLAKAQSDLGAARNQAQQMEQESERLRDRLSQIAGKSQNPTPPASGPRLDDRNSIADASPALTFQSGGLGPADLSVQILSAVANIPSVRVKLGFGEVPPNAVIDVLISAGDLKIVERNGVTVQGSGSQRYTFIVLQQDEVKRLVNREVTVTLSNRNRATLASVKVTLQLK
jgi:multidrug efflux pump subunit AcrA (membrane-fusion protein)